MVNNNHMTHFSTASQRDIEVYGSATAPTAKATNKNHQIPIANKNAVIIGDNKLELEPAKSDSILKQTVNNSIKGTIVDGQVYTSANIIPSTKTNFTNIQPSKVFSLSPVNSKLPVTGHDQKKSIVVSPGITPVNKDNNNLYTNNLPKENEAISGDVPLTEVDEKRAQEQAIIRRFNNEIKWTESLSHVGHAIIRSTTSQLDENDDAVLGYNKTRQYASIGASMLGIVGGKSVLRELKSQEKEYGNMALKYKELIGKNEISLADITKDADIFTAIKKGKEISRLNKTGKVLKGHNVKKAEYIKNSIIAQKTLQDFAASPTGSKILTNVQLDFIRSDDFFKAHIKTNQKLREQITSAYFNNHANPLLRDIKVTGLNKKKFKELLSRSNEYKLDRKGNVLLDSDGNKILNDKRLNISDADKSILEVHNKDRKLRTKKKATKKQCGGRRKVIGNALYNSMAKSGDNIFTGIRGVKQVYNAAKTTKSIIKAIVVSGGFIGKRAVLKPLLFISRKIGLTKKLNQLKAVKKIKVAKKVYKQKKREISKAVVNVKSAPKRYVKNQTKIIKDKLIKKVNSKVSKKVSKVAKAPIKILTSPIKYLRKMLDFTSMVKKKILIYAGAGMGIFVILYIMLVILVSSMTAVANSINKAIDTVILFFDDDEDYEDDNYVSQQAQMIMLIDNNDDERFKDAMDIATGTPKTNSVLGGHTITSYGKPTTTGPGGQIDEGTLGYKIIYQDKNGRDLGGKISNTKDILTITAAVFQNDLSNKNAVKQFEADLYKVMCPEPKVIESDIYFCGYGCSDYSYYCYNKNSCDGRTYQSISYNANGCSPYYTYCDGCEETETEDVDDEGNPIMTMTCPGHLQTNCPSHTIKVCYGHRDVEIISTLLFMDDITDDMLPSGQAYYQIINDFKEAGGFSEAREWMYNIYNQDWFELYDFDVNGGVGFTTGKTLTNDKISNITGSLPNLSEVKKQFIENALIYTGKIPYFEGGKASDKGWDNNAFGIKVTPDTAGRDLNGLDSSGFIGWLYWTTTDTNIGNTVSEIRTASTRISYNRLEPGDIGINNSGNYLGIYIGKDDNGKDMWVYEGSNSGNVTYGNAEYWTAYYRLIN